ncbi:ABC transporter substrate-binding protein [Salinibacterium sp. GXW1014]|uniref:ABC transporter substrate-binding protein n=1 Tax=Salinibacterium sp. GXW1014 TaxID=3377838 RepID=UPI00383B09F0
MLKRSVAASGAVMVSALLVLGLAACTSDSRVAEGTSVTVALDAPFTSYNPNTGHGSANDSNASVVAATNSSFASWDAEGRLIFDESFGAVEKLADDPLEVRYTIADGVEWSDGAEVDAADLLLSWAANSRALNDDDIDADKYVDPETGLFTEDFPDDAVYFDGFTANGLHLATRLPEIGDDDRSITLRFEEPVADWAAIFTVGLPAHVVGRLALDLDDEASDEEAKAAVVDAIATRDSEALAALSRAWNSGFAVEAGDVDPALLVGTGPYMITALASEALTLTANPRYRGEHRPRFETIEVRHISDPLEALSAFEDGEVDVLSPQVSADVMAALDDLEVEPKVTRGGVWDVLQLRFDDSANAAIENSEVRRALLASVPRDELIEAAGAKGADATARDSFTMMPGAHGYDDSVEASDGDRIEADARSAKRGLASAIADGEVKAGPTVCMLFDPANPRRVAQFSEIRDAAASVGIAVTDCSSPDWRNLLGTPGAWDAALYGLRDRTLSAQSATAMFGSDSPLNHGRFASEEIDEVLDELEREDDADARAALRAELDALLWQEGLGMPIAQLPVVTVVAPEVAGVSPSPYAPTVLHDAWRWRPADDPAKG